MSRKNIALLLSSLILAADFFLLPLLIQDTGSAMVIMLALSPLIVFIAAACSGLWAGFDWRLAVVTAVLFTPSIFRYYNESAWVYAPGYAAVAQGANALGAWLRKSRKS